MAVRNVNGTAGLFVNSRGLVSFAGIIIIISCIIALTGLCSGILS